MSERHPERDGFFSLEIFTNINKKLKEENKEPLKFHKLSFEFTPLVKKGGIYFNKDFTKFSQTHRDGFKNWHMIEEELFTGYRVDEVNTLHPTSAPTLNLSETKQLLLQKVDDEKSSEFVKNILKNNGSLLLDEKEQVPHLFLTSFPRSGNSFTRSICD